MATNNSQSSDSAHKSGNKTSMTRGVLANWSWYVVVIAMGFVTPRLIGEYRGQVLLGIWDFGWSFIVYISFLGFGITSAVNRYVAAFRTTQDWLALNKIVNTSLAMLGIAGVIGITAAFFLARIVPGLLSDASSQELATAHWMILLLALKASLQLPAGVFNGVITGYERFDWLNAIRVTRDLATLAITILLLVSGYGLIALALNLMVLEGLASVAKYFVARHLCAPLRCSPAYCDLKVVRELISFGGRTVIHSVAQGGIYQGSNILVAAFLGPAYLAVYSRQRALVMHVLRFVKQYAQVFIPRSSGLHAAGSEEKLRQTLIQTTRYGLFISLPMMIILITMGGPLLNLWMGPEYEAPMVLAVMAAGHLFYIPQLGVYSILMGMGRHGLPALVEFCAAVASVLLGLLVLGPMHAGLVAAACAMTIPLAVSGGIILPVYACRLLQTSTMSYLRQSAAQPVLCVLPLAAWLIFVRIVDPGSSLMQLLVGVIPGGLLTMFIYMRWVMSDRIREKIHKKFSFRNKNDKPHDTSPAVADQNSK